MLIENVVEAQGKARARTPVVVLSPSIDPHCPLRDIRRFAGIAQKSGELPEQSVVRHVTARTARTVSFPQRTKTKTKSLRLAAALAQRSSVGWRLEEAGRSFERETDAASDDTSYRRCLEQRAHREAFELRSHSSGLRACSLLRIKRDYTRRCIVLRPERTRVSTDQESDTEPRSPAQATTTEFYDLTRFTLADMVRCGAALRRLTAGCASMEEAAQKTARYLYEALRSASSNTRSCVLVRLFRTHSYGRLSGDLQNAGRSAVSSPVAGDMKCLVLLGTCGDEPQWNARRESKGHQCIPLRSEAVIAQFPMIARLIQQLGVPVSALLRPAPQIIKDFERKSFGVFYVPAALGSPFIPAQKDFVLHYGVQSALGFGGIQPDGELFVVIIFSRVAIPPSTAEMFRTIGLSLKLGMLSLVNAPVFAD